MIVSDRSRVRRVASTRSRRASLLVSTRSSSPSRRSVARIRGMPCVVTCSNHCGAAGSGSSRSSAASDAAAGAAALDATYEPDDSDPAAPQWFEHVTTHGMPRIRATLRLEGDELHVDTNSEARLDRVLATLRTLLRSLKIIDEERQPAHEIGEAMRRAGSHHRPAARPPRT